MKGPVQIELAHQTDVGVRRSHNQDCHLVVLAADAQQWQQQGHVFVVADGMGGHAVGELASDIAARSVPLIFQKHAAEGVPQALRKAFVETNTTIHIRGQQNREFLGMGTTTSALVLRPEGAWIGHVGDSRVYRIRGDRLEQLSFDHSRAWELARRQGIRPDQLEGVRTNVLVRSMGPEPVVEVDVEGPHPVRKGDVFLICSDGLTGPLVDQAIGAVTRLLPPAEAAQLLIDLANLHGGPDNITVIIVRVDEPLKAKYGGRTGPPVPWPLAVLVLGVLLAAGALYLTASKLPGGGLAFAAAILAILGGLVGLFFYQRGVQKHQADKPYRPRTRVYRQISCKIDTPLLEKLMNAESSLRQTAQERKWEVDWKSHEKHLQAAAEHRAQGDLTAAFRDYCRAMRPLTEKLAQHRHKEEVFQPVWDKARR